MTFARTPVTFCLREYHCYNWSRSRKVCSLFDRIQVARRRDREMTWQEAVLLGGISNLNEAACLLRSMQAWRDSNDPKHPPFDV